MAKLFMHVSEVAAELGISKSHAYKLVQKMNTEMQEMGYITIAGRINRKYFMEKTCYGSKGGQKDGSLQRQSD